VIYFLTDVRRHVGLLTSNISRWFESSKQDKLTRPGATWIMKEFSNLLAPFITLLFSKSLDSRQYHQSFKHAVALPLLKKENMDPTQLNNYRG